MAEAACRLMRVASDRKWNIEPSLVSLVGLGTARQVHQRCIDSSPIVVDNHSANARRAPYFSRFFSDRYSHYSIVTCSSAVPQASTVSVAVGG